MSQQADYFESDKIDEFYDSHTYGKGLSGWVLRKSHELVEQPFNARDSFPNVLEVGAGTGVHLQYVRHHFDTYHVTDSSQKMLTAARARHPGNATGNVVYKEEDAAELSFDSESVDRVIAAHVLEHIPSPQLVLDEWWRVLRPGGILSLVLPCDPGVLWRFGRALGPRGRAQKGGLSYDYVMALEHINAITNLKAIISHKYDRDKIDDTWWPVRLPITDLNLIYCANIKK